MNKVMKVIIGLLALFVFAVLVPAYSTAIDLALPYLDEPTAIVVQLYMLAIVLGILWWIIRDDEPAPYGAY